MRVIHVVFALFIGGVIASQGAEAPLPLSSQIQRNTDRLDNSGAITLSYADVVARVQPCVVTVLTTRLIRPQDPDTTGDSARNDLNLEKKRKDHVTLQQEEGGGSGVVITKAGHILTNYHVIRGAAKIRVRLPDGSSDLIASLVGQDPLTDLAVLKVEAELSPIIVADSNSVRPGDVVLALGSPFGLEQTVTLGIVSATGRTMNFIRGGYEDYIQTDAPINPGNSGGALVDGHGRLIGINTAVYSGGWSEANSIGFAVPVNLALRVANDLLLHGHVVRGFLGMRLVEVDEAQARVLGSRPDLRAGKVSEIEAGSPADTAGVIAGDVILQLNGRSTRTLAQLRYGIATLLPGGKVELGIVRGGTRMTLSATLGEMPGNALTDTASFKPGNIELQSGLEVTALNDAEKLTWKVPSTTVGVLVTRAEMDGKPIIGLLVGDVLLEINGTRLTTPDEARNTFRGVPQGQAIFFRVWRSGDERFATLKKNK